MKINFQGIKDNAQNFAGIIIGLCVLKPFNLRYNKSTRGSMLFSTVAANNAAEGFVTALFPYKVFFK